MYKIGIAKIYTLSVESKTANSSNSQIHFSAYNWFLIPTFCYIELERNKFKTKQHQGQGSNKSDPLFQSGGTKT